MRALTKVPGATKRKMEKCNMCRLYSRVVTLSDLSHLDGTHIPWKHISGEWRTDSMLHLWPIMPKPPPEFWSTYRNFIRKAFCQNKNHNASRVPLILDTRLGAWLDVAGHTSYPYHRTETNLYCKQEGYYEKFTPSSTTSRVWKYRSKRRSRPLLAHPIHAMRNRHEIFMRQDYSIIKNDPGPRLNYTS